MRGVARYIEETSYEIVLYSIGLARNHFDVLDRILAIRMISGLLAIFPGQTIPELMKCYTQGLPLVLIDDQEEPGTLPWVGIDNREAAYAATRYLLECGHRCLAFLQGPPHYVCCQQRYAGFSQALHDFALTPQPDLLLHGDFESPSGYQAARTLFERPRASWPTAIFASNDEMAQGILEYARQQGIAIPEEITVIGFDDNIVSGHLHPPLTTIHQPFYEMGIAATSLLMKSINPEHTLVPEAEKQLPSHIGLSLAHYVPEQAPLRLSLPAHLIVRSSSASPAFSLEVP
jgi:LacI family transcriptional regulator